MIAPVATYRFSVDESHKLGETGILGEDDRIELLDGELTIMPPIGSPHFAALNRLSQLFNQRLLDRCTISPRNPVRLDPYSEPQPDIALLKPASDFYKAGLPGPADVFLLVEVADSSLLYDREKLKFYVRANIREVWIVNLSQRAMEVYRRPEGAKYASEQRLESGMLAAEAFPDVSFPVQEILS